MDAIIRKFPRGSRRKVASEIRTHCCNLWHGDKCLLLDKDIEHRCTQLDADSIKCSWFRDAVLPGNPVLLAEITQTGVPSARVCEVCGEKFKAAGNRSKYCVRCGKKVRRQQAATRKQKQRANVTL